MPRQVQLTEQIDGINLMRQKGGASPSSLFDLKNGWVTSKRTIKARPGSVHDVTFPAGTVGMVAMDGFFHTFSHAAIVGPIDTNVIVNIMRHPTGGSAAIAKIHRAFPFLRRLYVVVEFADGVIQHYWNENPASWTANTVYAYGTVVQPPTANGFYYEILTVPAVGAWQPNSEVIVGTIRHPRAANNFRYTVTATTGAAPTRTGNTEPTWPVVDGATVVERRYITEQQLPPGSSDPPPPPPIPPGGGGGGNNEFAPFPVDPNRPDQQLQ